MKQAFLLLCSYFLLLCHLQAQKPELVLPTIHAQPVKEISFSADGRYLATCSGKEIKLWETSSGQLIRSILSPVEIERISLSNDGTRLVSGSYCGVPEDLDGSPEDEPEKRVDTDLRCWNMETGEPLSILKAFGRSDRIWQVCISPDMRVVFARYGDSLGIWDIKTGTQLWAATGKSKGIFSADGNHLLLSASTGLQWVNWRAGGTSEPLWSDSCYAVQCTPDFVIGFTQKGVIKRWNIANRKLAPEVKPDLSGLGLEDAGGLFTFFGDGILFSADGRKLSILSYINPDDSTEASDSSDSPGFRMRVLSTQTGRWIIDQKCPFFFEDNLMRIKLSPDLSHYFTVPSTEAVNVLSTIRSYSTTEEQLHEFGLESLVVSTSLNAILPSEGNRVYNQGRILFIYRENESLPNTVVLPESGKVLTGVPKDSLQVLLGNQALVEDKHWKLICEDGLSYQLKNVQTGKVEANLLLIDSYEQPSPTGLFEGSSRLWAVTSSSGLFDASPEMMESLHYVVGMEIIELEQLKETYYEPGLLGKILGYSEEPLREAEGLDTIKIKLYPSVNLKLDTLTHQLRIKLQPRSGGIGKVSLFINEKEVLEEANPRPRDFTKPRPDSMNIDLSQYSRYFLPDASNKVSVRAYNADGWLKSAPISVTYKPSFAQKKGAGQNQGSIRGALDAPPNLYLVSVGTANYAGTKLDLKYAGKDAVDMASALRQIGQQLLKGTPGKVYSYVLSTDSAAQTLAPTKTNIKAVFDSLKTSAHAQDILVVYLSGHGVAKGNEFYYLTQAMSSFDLDLEGPSKTISSTELTNWIKSVPALKQVLILDACNSGKVVESLTGSSKGMSSSQVRALDRLKDRTGMFVLSGSAADMLSYESGKFGQGLLTYSLLQGIQILGSENENRVDVMKWFQHACDEVPKLASGIQGIQTPMVVGPTQGSFDVGMVNDAVHIPLKDSLPVLIRSTFMNENTLTDELGLTKAVKTLLQSKSDVKKPELIYVDVNEYAAAFSIRGLYQQKQGQATLHGFLFKGEKPIGNEFRITGAADPKKLANALLKELWPEIRKP